MAERCANLMFKVHHGLCLSIRREHFVRDFLVEFFFGLC